MSQSRTALAGRNRIECDECGEELESEQKNARHVRWGFWSEERQYFKRGPRNEYYCAECWRTEFARDAAAHYEITDRDRFWNILDAADGDLVADLRPIFVGGRPWIRVVDGDLQAMRATREMDTRPNTPILKFDTEPVDLDREWFEETFKEDMLLPDDGRPTLALLKPAEETPFDGWNELPEDQTTLAETNSEPEESVDE